MLRIKPVYLTVLAIIFLFFSCDIHEKMKSCENSCIVQLTAAGIGKGNIYSALRLGKDLSRLTLWIFDEKGLFLEKTEIDGEIIKANDYTFRLALGPGNYKFIAWIGAEDQLYKLPELTPGISTEKELTLKLDRNDSKSQNEKLTPLWHGFLPDVEVLPMAETRVVLPMIKDTNTLITIVQSTSGEDIISGDFDLKILADNGFIDYNNSLLQDDRLTYGAYWQQSVQVDAGPEESTQSVSVLRAEMNTLRLLTNKSVRFVITDNKTGANILDINLIQYLLLTREMEEVKEGISLLDQDYLDFQDIYSIIFFLTPTGNEKNPYLVLTLNINGWTIRPNDGIL